VLDQRRNDGAKGRSDHNRNGKIEDITAHDKVFEFF